MPQDDGLVVAASGGDADLGRRTAAKFSTASPSSLGIAEAPPHGVAQGSTAGESRNTRRHHTRESLRTICLKGLICGRERDAQSQTRVLSHFCDG